MEIINLRAEHLDFEEHGRITKIRYEYLPKQL